MDGGPRAGAAGLLAAILATACGQGADGRATPRHLYSPLPSVVVSDLAPCVYPSSIPEPTWFPSDLPLPEDTYATQDLSNENGHQAVFLIPRTIENLAAFMEREWPAAGYEFGLGESEPGEFEVVATDPPDLLSIRANQTVCEPGFTQMLIVYRSG